MGNGQLTKRLLTDFAIFAPIIAVFFTIYFFRQRSTLRFFQRCESLGNRIARHRIRTGLLIGVLSFSLSASIALCSHLPLPSVSDEFSYLLAADTFAHGRLTNPTHPMWQHFESFHIIQQPTYASKYPPGQGMMMALGQVLTGYPAVGVWLSVAVACALIFWALSAYLTPCWALLGAIFTVVHPLNILWGQNYWGGAVAVIGGTLVIGAVKRIVKDQKPRNAFFMGLGLAVLANSRPYEGLVFSAAVFVVLLIWMVRQNRVSTAVLLKRIAAPIFAVLFITCIFMAKYNLVVTGDVLRMPYQVHQYTYEISPVFVFLPPHPEPTFRHKDLHDAYLYFSLSWYEEQHASVRALLTATKAKFLTYPTIYFEGLVLGFPLLTIPFMLRKDKWVQVLLFVLVITLIGLSLEVFTHFHYAAPMFGLIMALSLRSARHLRLLKWKKHHVGKVLVYAWAAYCVIGLSYLSIAANRGRKSESFYKRAQIIKELSQVNQNHLIIVRYGPNHWMTDEYVYNEADIDKAKVVWARDMGDEENHTLIDYFKDRRAWLLNIDTDVSDLVPYEDSQQNASLN